MSKYLKLVNGESSEAKSVSISTGASDADKLISTDTDGKINISLIPSGLGADNKSIIASEGLGNGDKINLWSDTGVLKMRKADAATNKRADGFILASVTTGAAGLCFFSGINNQLTGLTIGADYYLSDSVPGGITATPVTAADNKILQKVGRALSATELLFEPGPVVHLIS